MQQVKIRMELSQVIGKWCETNKQLEQTIAKVLLVKINGFKLFMHSFLWKHISAELNMKKPL